MPTLTTEQLQALVNNLATCVPKTSFLVAGRSYPIGQIVKVAASMLAARSATAGAKAKWRDTRTQSAVVERDGAPIVNAVRVMLVQMLSHDTSVLQALAVAPRKVATPLTSEERVVAMAKNRATRQARGTMSTKKKRQIKGNVTGVVVTPLSSAGALEEAQGQAKNGDPQVAVP